MYHPGQPGKTHETFDEERFVREVAEPVEELTKSDASNPLRLILFVIPCTIDVSKDRSCEEARFPAHNLEELETPTSRALKKHLARQYANGLWEDLNIPSWEGSHYAPVEVAKHYAQSQQCDGLIICPPGSLFPTVDEVFEAVNRLKKGRTLVLIPSTVVP